MTQSRRLLRKAIPPVNLDRYPTVLQQNECQSRAPSSRQASLWLVPGMKHADTSNNVDGFHTQHFHWLVQKRGKPLH
jgi:hypothetical protein